MQVRSSNSDDAVRKSAAAEAAASSEADAGGTVESGKGGSDLAWYRFDTGRLCYTEALYKGRYVVAGFSAMGRPMTGKQVQRELQTRGFMIGANPWHFRGSWECAFQLEVDGILLDGRWGLVSEHIAEGAGKQAHRIVLAHEHTPVEVTVATALDDTCIFARHLEIRSLSDRPLKVSRVRGWSGRIFRLHGWDTRHSWQDSAFTVTHFPDFRYGNEGAVVREPLGSGGRIFSSSTGKSGQGYPMVFVTNNRTAETFICNLEWSGNWQMEAIRENESNRDEADQVFFRAGPEGVAPVYVLEPGGTLTTPACHIGWSFGSLDECVSALHTHMRRSCLPEPSGKARFPVVFNNSGYSDNRQIDEAALVDQVDIAHEAGSELFIIDAGWFGDRDAVWYELVGDWKESSLLDGGLRAVYDRVHSHGMLGGLWVEIERMAEGSGLAKAHPEWWMRRNDEIIGQLDLAKPEVVDHLYETICRLIEAYRLDCFRLDYNLRQGEGGQRLLEGGKVRRDGGGRPAEGGKRLRPGVGYGFYENTQWRYYEGLYGLFDRVRSRYPDLIFENCSSGGGRMDLGMMSRFHWTQVSDNWDPVPTLKIVYGMLHALPPEQVMTLIGAVSPARADLDFTLRIALFGRMCLSGIYPRAAEIHAESLDRWKRAVGIYREFVRPWLAGSVVHHHTGLLRQEVPGDWCVLELAAEDASRSMIGVWRLYEPGDHRIVVCPRGIDVDRRYKVTFDNTGRSTIASGYDLKNSGAAVRVKGNLCSELLLIEAE